MKAVRCTDFHISELGAYEPCDQCLADFKRGEEYEVEIQQYTQVVSGYLQAFWQATVRTPHDDEFGFPLYAIFNSPLDINYFFIF